MKKSKAVDSAPAPLQDPEMPNMEQQELADLMTQFDNNSISIDESQWRPLSDAEKGVSVEWLRKRRIGEKTMLPQCLRKFATRELTEESDAMLSKRREGRKVMMSCIFRKPGFDKAEDGDEMIKVGFKVSDAAITGTTAQELFGKTRVNLEFSRRPMTEFDNDRAFIDGTRPIYEVITEVHSFGWNGGNWSFSALVPADTYPLEEAIADWKAQGTVRVEVLNKLDPETEEPEETAPKRGRGRPKKEKPEQTGPTLFGGTEKKVAKQPDIPMHVSIALTNKCRLALTVKQLEDGRWESTWSGENLAGGCSEQEPSIRMSQSEAAVSSLGRAIDSFGLSEDDESKEIVTEAKKWLKSLMSGQSLADIARVDAEVSAAESDATEE